MKIERPIYMQQLIDSKDNGLIKIVTGLRRVGKSYLLKTYPLCISGCHNR